MALKKWNELPVNVRRSKAARWDYLVSELEGESSSDDEEVDSAPVTYRFTSYEDSEGTTEWGTGTVETTGVVSGQFTQVVVLTNSSDQDFVGQKFFIRSTAKTDGTVYTVYSDAGRTNAGFYVSIEDVE